MNVNDDHLVKYEYDFCNYPCVASSQIKIFVVLTFIATHMNQTHNILQYMSLMVTLMMIMMIMMNVEFWYPLIFSLLVKLIMLFMTSILIGMIKWKIQMCFKKRVLLNYVKVFFVVSIQRHYIQLRVVPKSFQTFCMRK